MELDKRIIKGKRPLTCFDIKEARKYVGKLCYVSNSYDCFRDLKNLVEEVILIDVEDCETPFHFYIDNQREFCLPAEWVKPEEPEKKYRPYTIKDFEKAFLNDEFDDFIIFREKNNPEDVYTMRYNGNFRKGEFEYICLGAKNFSFESLFENYEVANYDGDFVPFGVLEE